MNHLLQADYIKKPAFAIHKRVGAIQTHWHTHPVHKLLYTEDGVLHLETDEYHVLLPAQHGAWIPSRLPHRVTSTSPNLYWRTIYFRPHSEEVSSLLTPHVFPISTLAREMIVFTAQWSIDHPLEPLEKQFFQTLRLLIPTWCQEALPLMLPLTSHPQLNPITSYIQENLAEPLRLDEVAKLYGFSGRTLMRLFQRELKMTFGLYLRMARIIRAIELLTQTDLSITEVALRVGYDSGSSFSQAFSQLVGRTPREYMRGQRVEISK